MRYLDYAEEIPVRILQHDIVGMWLVSPRVPPCPEADESFHFIVLVRRIEIEVQPTPLPGPPGGRLVERDVGPLPPRVSKNHETTTGIDMLNHVEQRRLPEGMHQIEFVATYDDRANGDTVGLGVPTHRSVSIVSSDRRGRRLITWR